MKFDNKLPEWGNEGTEPSTELKTNGFQGGYKPPAGVFNWFWSKVSKAITEIQAKFNANIVTATSTDGVAYTATVNGITELYNGLEITIIPNTKSTSAAITLDINGLGAVPIRRPLSFSTFVATNIDSDRTYFLSADTPCRLMYHANYTTGGIWLMAEKQKTSAQDLYGTVPIDGGGTGASTVEDAREKLEVAQAKESNVTSLKGCYYRGDNEWINPPLESGGIYKTTERFYNKPVYAMAIQTGTMKGGASKLIETDSTYETHSLISISGAIILSEDSTYHAVDSALSFNVYGNTDGNVSVKITNTSGDALSAKLILKFTVG